jgi:hypothetical protein
MERESAHQGNYKYRLWIDTLCCPVERSGKMISLERIALVYRNATHVLVLDSSISGYSTEAASPTELLVRAFCTSSWMRRLWTLQGKFNVRCFLTQLTHVYDKDD